MNKSVQGFIVSPIRSHSTVKHEMEKDTAGCRALNRNYIVGDIRMNKYTVYRSLGTIDRDIKKHIVAAVEYGKDVYAVTDALIKAVCDDALSIEKYRQWYTASAYAPEPVEDFRRVKRYAYYMTAVLSPERGEKNDLIEYGVTEQAGSEPV